MKKWLLVGIIGLALLLWEGYDIMTNRMKGPRWDRLIPEMKQKTMDLLTAAKAAGLDVMFFDGWRTKEASAANMASGSSQVSSPLSSYHCWGMASDIVFANAAGFPYWPPTNTEEGLALWKKLGAIGQSVGLTWGGEWKSFDADHFQLKGKSIAVVRAEYGDDTDAYLKDNGITV